jgi:hypothetical protein
VLDRLGLADNKALSGVLEIFEEALENGDTSQFEDASSALFDIGMLVMSFETDPMALEDSLTAFLVSLGISTKNARHIIVSSIADCFVAKLEETGFANPIVVQRVRALATSDIQKARPIIHAMMPIVLGTAMKKTTRRSSQVTDGQAVSSESLVGILRALGFTKSKTEELVTIAALTLVQQLVISLGIDPSRRNIVQLSNALQKKERKAEEAEIEAEKEEEETEKDAEEAEEGGEEGEEESEAADGDNNKAEPVAAMSMDDFLVEKTLVGKTIDASLALMWAADPTELELTTLLKTMGLEEEEIRRALSASVRRLLYAAGLCAGDTCMKACRELLEEYILAPGTGDEEVGLHVKQSSFVQRQCNIFKSCLLPRSRRAKKKLQNLLHCAVPLICFPGRAQLPEVILLLKSVHAGDAASTKRVLEHVAKRTVRLTLWVKARAIQQSEEAEETRIKAEVAAEVAEAEAAAAAAAAEANGDYGDYGDGKEEYDGEDGGEGNEEGGDGEEEVAAEEDEEANEEDEEERGGEEEEEEAELHATKEEIAEWLQGPTNLANECVTDVGHNKRLLKLLAKSVLPLMCGNDNTVDCSEKGATKTRCG